MCSAYLLPPIQSKPGAMENAGSWLDSTLAFGANNPREQPGMGRGESQPWKANTDDNSSPIPATGTARRKQGQLHTAKAGVERCLHKKCIRRGRFLTNATLPVRNLVAWISLGIMLGTTASSHPGTRHPCKNKQKKRSQIFTRAANNKVWKVPWVWHP